MRPSKMTDYTWCRVSEHFCSFNNTIGSTSIFC